MLGEGPSRAQSETLGALLVLALVMVGIALVLAGGGQAINSSSQAVNEEQTQEALVSLAGEIDAITHGTADTKQATLNLNLEGSQNAVQVRGEAGSIRIDVGGSTVYEDSFGAVVLESGDTTIGYQGGGVWRIDDSGASIVSAPDISERGSAPSTLTMPVIQVTGSTSLGDTTSASLESSSQLYPSISVGASETVTIHIESQFARAWAEFFTSSLGLDESAVTVSNDGTVVDVEYASSQEAFFHSTQYQVRISE